MTVLLRLYCKEILIVLIILSIIIIPILLDKVEHSGQYDLTNIDAVVNIIIQKIEALFKFKK